MKKILVFSLLSIMMISCGVTKTKVDTRSPQEVKMMTTKQFEVDKDLAFKAAISLLQANSFIIQDASKETGLINAYRREDNKNAASQRFWTGSSVDAFLTKIVFYIEDLNPELTEVKITIYDGKSVTYGNASFGAAFMGAKNVYQTKDQTENMVYDSGVYADWFNQYRAEIERRRALTQ